MSYDGRQTTDDDGSRSTPLYEVTPFDGLERQDIILQIIGDIGVAGATYRSIEFAGSALGQLSMEERQTL